MKVYVDKLPRCCNSCPCREDEYCNLYWRNKKECLGIIDDIFNDRRNEHCPLLSIADYTKQVRKEVIDKVYEVLEQAVPHDLCWSWAVIKKELDQIQGE